MPPYIIADPYPSSPWVGLAYIVGCILLGVCFYWLQRKHPGWYGISEVVVAVIVIYLAFYPPSVSAVAKDTPWLAHYVFRVYGIIAGIYLFVRGMGNIYESLSEKWPARWDCIFPR
jgi:hypothetical protein